jgi:hypothetical protein
MGYEEMTRAGEFLQSFKILGRKGQGERERHRVMLHKRSPALS